MTTVSTLTLSGRSKMVQNEGDALQYMWAVYTNLRSRTMDIPSQLDHWANDIAKPYLTKHRPTALIVDITDPRKARRHYDEPEVMETDEDEGILKSKEAEPWKLVPGKTKPTPV